MPQPQSSAEHEQHWIQRRRQRVGIRGSTTMRDAGHAEDRQRRAGTRNGLRPPVVSTQRGKRNAQQRARERRHRDEEARAPSALRPHRVAEAHARSARTARRRAKPTKKPSGRAGQPETRAALDDEERSWSHESLLRGDRGPAEPANDLRPPPEIRIRNDEHVHEPAEREDGDDGQGRRDVQLDEHAACAAIAVVRLEPDERPEVRRRDRGEPRRYPTDAETASDDTAGDLDEQQARRRIQSSGFVTPRRPARRAPAAR